MLDNSSDQQPIIEAKDLTTRFDIKSGMFGKVTGRVHAVEGVNFHVNPKETLSLVGSQVAESRRQVDHFLSLLSQREERLSLKERTLRTFRRRRCVQSVRNFR